MLIQVDDKIFLQHISNIYHLTLLVMDGRGSSLERFSPDPEGSEYLFQFSNLRERFVQLCEQTHKPLIISSELNQVWVGLPTVDVDPIRRILVIGPVFTSGPSRDMILDYARSYNIGTQPREKLLEALFQTPVYPYSELTRPVSMIYAFLYDQELDLSSMTITGLAKNELPIPSDAFSTEPVDAAQPGDAMDPALAFRMRMMECVREGKLDELKRLLKTITYTNSRILGTNPDPIRRQKNMLIHGLALAEQAAMDGGLKPEIAYSLTNHYMDQVEALNSVLPILMLHRDMLYDFTNRMNRLKHSHQYSKLVNDCCNFIHEHLHDPLRVAEVTEFTGFNANYVARKFREETGKSINDYIRDAKTEEAKALLKYSNLSLAEIGEQLSFSSQSFFTATFREVTGLTPRQYREKQAE
jgi:AraC-like DNA-binding protein